MNATKPATFRLMTIFAHPDDETFGVAGSMARATEQGAEVVVVSATRGEVGEIADSQLATPATLGQVREQELRAAVGAVGVSQVYFLDYIDGQLSAADPQEAVGRIVWLIRRFRPDIVVTFNANGLYGHPDHMAIHRLVLAAVPAAADGSAYPGLAPHQITKVYFNGVPRESLLMFREQMKAQGQDFVPGGNAATIPVEEMGDPEATITTRVVLTDDELRRKVTAMQAHATQTPADSPFASQDLGMVRQMMGTEYFTLAPAPYTHGTFAVPESDLAAGLA